tara:strand:+ start:471 stop:1238 length:768 start_codon:yes stop_codon:yes gene_type:complete
MNDIETVALVGNGNVAMVLGSAWQRQGIHFAAFCNRSATLPVGLERKDAQVISDPGQIPSDVDAILVAVTDDAILEVMKQLPSRPLVIHFSGCIPDPAQAGGVLWPIQSIVPNSKSMHNGFPIALSCSKSAHKAMTKFAKLIASELHELSEIERQTAHLAAVFAANFTNHCFALAQELCQRAALPWNLFQPIARQIIEQAVEGTSKQRQTGPAIREDQSAIDAHLGLLAQHPEFEPVYTAMTKSIQSLHQATETP